MKKILKILMVASIFSLVACGSVEETKVTEEIIEEVTAEVTEEAAPVELAEHVCAEKCTAEACHFACGEKGHVCSDACHATEEASEEHVHAEGDDHNHAH
jgi:hypothetical protein